MDKLKLLVRKGRQEANRVLSTGGPHPSKAKEFKSKLRDLESLEGILEEEDLRGIALIVAIPASIALAWGILKFFSKASEGAAAATERIGEGLKWSAIGFSIIAAWFLFRGRRGSTSAA